MAFFNRLAGIVRRHWAERHIYSRRSDWLLSIYNKILVHLPRAPLPGRRRLHAVRLEGSETPLHVRLGTSDWYVLEEIFIRGEYAALTDRNVQGVSNIVDLGANVGMSVRLWQTLYPGARIAAIEPDEDNLHMAAMNANGDNAVLLRACAAASPRKVYLDRSTADWAFEMRDTPTPTSVEIDALTIPQILIRAGLSGPIDLLKCDIEGAEAELFRNCSAWIGKVQELVVEVHHPYTSEMLVKHIRAGGSDLKVYHTSSKPGPAVVFLSRQAVGA